MDMQLHAGEQIVPTKKRKPDIQKVARDSFDAADGDVKKAVEIMSERVKKNKPLFSALMMPMIDDACYREIGKICRHERRVIWNTPNASANGNGDRVTALARGNMQMLMNFPLPGGKPLGDATKDEVGDAAKFYGAQASDMGHKSRWLTLITNELEEEKSVREVMSEERLRILQEQSNG